MDAKQLWTKHQDHLHGSWKLVSYVQYKNGKVHGLPHGDYPLGFSQISENAYISSHLATPDRMTPPRPEIPWSAHNDAEIAYVSRGISMYCGQMELFETEDGLAWKTMVDVSNDPSRIGGYQIRGVVLSEENGQKIMTLTPLNKEANQNGVSSILKWHKFV